MLRLILLFTCVFSSLTVCAQENNQSQQLFESLNKKIVQIKILSNNTGEKASIGSGFLIEKENLIATNYHVISQIATRPTEFYGKYRTVDNELGNFELITFDVINDLALLRADKHIAPPFKIAELPPKGASIFSLGNPHDLGFVIVDGANNGIIPNSSPPRVLFSASINSGMSGGPTVNRNSEVVAINVAVKRRSGDISFLVPARYLTQLIDIARKDFFTAPSFPETKWEELIASQLQKESKLSYEALAKNKIPTLTLGTLSVPSKPGNDFKCWNQTQEEEEKDWAIQRTGFSCAQRRDHYISQKEFHGYLSIGFQHFTTEAEISRRQFYRHIERQQNLGSFKYFSEKEDNKYKASCTSEFVHIAEHEFKLHICAQDDKKREGISLVRVLATSVDLDNEAWMFKMTADGAAVKDVLTLSHRLLKKIQPVEKGEE